jgi:molecular chaperone GrpE
MYKNRIPADVFAREPHPMEQNRCYSGPVDVSALEQQLTEQHERYVRLAADFENFKKRATQEIEKKAAAQKEALLRDLLPVIDNLDRALANSAPGLNDPLRQGVEMTFRQFIQMMREHGFEARDDIGGPFDPSYHEAVCTRAEPGQDYHSIVEVWQRGWMHGDKLFRPAKVVVNDFSTATEETTDREGELSHV